MARPGVTYTEVENAAKRLQAEGRQPTIDAIRQMIGSGSDTTIMRHLKSWKERHSLELQAGNLPLPLIETIQGLWSRLKHEASTEITAYEEKAREEIEVMEEVLSRAQEQNTGLKRENGDLQTSLTQFQVKIEELTALLQAEKTENVRLKEQNDGLNRQCSQQGEEIVRQHQIVRQTQANLEHYQAANLKLKEAHSLERENERNQYLQTVRELEARVNTLSQDKGMLEHTLSQVNTTLTDASQVITDLQNAFLEHTGEAAENKTKLALLEQQNLSLTQQLDKHGRELKKSTEQLCSALNQISSTTSKQELLETSLRKAEDKVQNLMDEKLFLVQEKAELVGQMKSLSTHRD